MLFEEEVALNNYDINCLNDVYKDIGSELGIETALRIFNMYRGTQVTFPIRLLSSEYIKAQIKSENNGKNVKALAVKYHYSERNIRRILKESK